MILVDDRRLAAMAEDRQEALFPWLSRAEAFGPLVVVLTMLPVLEAVLAGSPTEESALWGLRASNVATATTLSGFVDLPLRDVPDRIAWSAPLSTWLAALAIRLTGSSFWTATALVPCLAAAATVPLAYEFWKRFVDGRAAFWAALLLALHPVFLGTARTAEPVALATLLLLATFRCVLEPRRPRSGPVSLPLACAGVALGLLWLASGPATLFALVVLWGQAVAGFGRKGDAEPEQETGAPRGWSGVRDVALVTGIALLLGGWWTAAMWWRHGLPALQIWAGLVQSEAAGGSPSLPGAVPATWTGGARELVGHLLPLTAIGAVRLVADVWTRTKSDELPPGFRRLFAAWCGAAAVTCGRAIVSGAPLSAAETTMGLLPCTGLAVHGLAAIGARRVRFDATIATCVFCWGLRFAPQAWMPAAADGEPATSGLVVVLACTTAIALGTAWWLRSLFEHHDERQRIGLTTVAALVLASHAAAGVRTLPSGIASEPEWSAWTKPLEEIGRLDGALIVAHEEAPQRLRLAVRTTWPDVEMRTVRTWDAALETVLSEFARPEQSVIVVDWGMSDARPARLHLRQFDIDRIGETFVFDGHDLRRFVVRPIGATRADRGPEP